MPWTTLRHSVCLSVLPLIACAQAGADRAAAPEPSQRVVLTTAIEWPGIAEVQNRAARLSGVTVRDAMEMAPRRYRLTLVCADADACRAAMARIAADRSFALAVEADGRVQIPTKPARDASR